MDADGGVFVLTFLIFLSVALSVLVGWIARRVTMPTIIGGPPESAAVLDKIVRGQVTSLMQTLHDEMLTFRSQLADQKEALANCRRSEAEMTTKMQVLREQVVVCEQQIAALRVSREQ